MHSDSSWLDAAGRLLIVTCFLVTGLCNLTKARIKDHIERMAVFHTPFPAAAFWTGIGLQLFGCALLLAGWHAASGALSFSPWPRRRSSTVSGAIRTRRSAT